MVPRIRKILNKKLIDYFPVLNTNNNNNIRLRPKEFWGNPQKILPDLIPYKNLTRKNFTETKMILRNEFFVFYLDI